MWLFTTIGFLSVVEDRKTKTRVCVRARAKRDLDQFRERYCPELGPTTTSAKSGADYACRAFCTKQQFAAAMGKQALDIDYTNFKSRVMTTSGWTREGVYMRVWSTMKDAQYRGDMDRFNDSPPPLRQSRLFDDRDRGVDLYDDEVWENGPSYRKDRDGVWRQVRDGYGGLTVGEIAGSGRIARNDELRDPFFGATGTPHPDAPTRKTTAVPWHPSSTATEMPRKKRKRKRKRKHAKPKN